MFVICWNHPAWPGLGSLNVLSGHMSELGTISRVWAGVGRAGGGQGDNRCCSWSINTAPSPVCSIHCSGVHHAAGAIPWSLLQGRGEIAARCTVEVVQSCCCRVGDTRPAGGNECHVTVTGTMSPRMVTPMSGQVPAQCWPLLIIREMPTPGSPGYFANRFLVTPGRGGGPPGPGSS